VSKSLSPSRHASLLPPLSQQQTLFYFLQIKYLKASWWWPSDERHNRLFDQQHSFEVYQIVFMVPFLSFSLPPLYFSLLFYSWNDECYVILAFSFLCVCAPGLFAVWFDPSRSGDGRRWRLYVSFSFYKYIFLNIFLRGVCVNDVKDRRAAGYIYDPARWSDANAWAPACKSFLGFLLVIYN
jgi:hypothetical protein